MIEYFLHILKCPIESVTCVKYYTQEEVRMEYVMARIYFMLGC
jgi:hypothetical protein